MRNDLRHGLRSLRQNPAFALTAIVSIALGIGANASIFSFTDGLLLRPLPVPNPSRVVALRARTPSGNFGDLSYADYADYRDKNRAFAGLVAYQLAAFGFAADPKAQAQLKVGFFVSGNFFRDLEVEPSLGRGFRPEEDQVPGRDAVTVLAHDFWLNEFGADNSVIGRRIRLQGVDFTVIGVAPAMFTGMDQYIRPALFVPVMMAPGLQASDRDLLTNRGKRAFLVKGRLKPGVSLDAGNAEAAALAKALEQSYPVTNRGYSVAMRTEMQTRLEFDPITPVLLALLFALVMVVLLIACANVANLTLSRGQARAREIAVRLAIGASRAQLVRRLMAESLLIALAGGGIGLLIAESAVRVFSTMQVPGDIPIQLAFQLDVRVLIFTLATSVLSAVLLGLVPALQSTNADLVTALKSGESQGGRQRFIGRNMLVIAQVAGSLVLMIAATQLYRAFSSALRANHGFRTDHRLLMRFDPSLAGYTAAQTEQFYKTLIDRVRDAPGVKSAGLTFAMPMTTDWGRPQAVVPEGYQFPKGKEAVDVMSGTVDQHFFETFGVPLIAGRGFLETDRSDSPRVAVVNEVFARHYLSNTNAVGKRIRLGGPNGTWVQIAGITVTGKYVSLLEPPIEFLYLPLSQNPQPRLTLITESYGDALALVGPLRNIVRSIDANLPVFGIRTLDDLFEQRSTKVLHLINGIVGLVGLAGFGLALVGLYAVVAYRVARRTREIGIRIALGADRFRVLRMVLKQAAVIGLVGVAIGALLSLAFGRALSIGLVGLGVPAFDPAPFSLVLLGLLSTILLAAAIPARRAARIDPMQALRQD